MSDDAWPDCPVRGCEFKICLALNSDKCFHHTQGNRHVKGWKIEARNAHGSCENPLLTPMLVAHATEIPSHSAPPTTLDPRKSAV